MAAAGALLTYYKTRAGNGRRRYVNDGRDRPGGWRAADLRDRVLHCVTKFNGVCLAARHRRDCVMNKRASRAAGITPRMTSASTALCHSAARTAHVHLLRRRPSHHSSALRAVDTICDGGAHGRIMPTTRPSAAKHNTGGLHLPLPVVATGTCGAKNAIAVWDFDAPVPATQHRPWYYCIRCMTSPTWTRIRQRHASILAFICTCTYPLFSMQSTYNS